MTNPNPNAPKSNEGRDRSGTSQQGSQQDEGTSVRGTSGFAPHQGKQQNPASTGGTQNRGGSGGSNDAIECLDRCSEQLESARSELQKVRQAISAQGSSSQSQSQGQNQGRNPNQPRGSQPSETSEQTERPSMGR